MTLTQAQLAEIQDLLSAGLANTEIARRTGVSRKTIKRIKDGVLNSANLLSEKERVRIFSEWGQGAYTRCSSCGHLVKLPCVACATEQSTSEANDVVSDALALDLHGEEKVRHIVMRMLKRHYRNNIPSDVLKFYFDRKLT